MICVYLYGNGTSARRTWVYFGINLCTSTWYHWTLHQTDCWMFFFNLRLYCIVICETAFFLFLFCYFYMKLHEVEDLFLRRCSKNVEMLWITKHRGNISFYRSKIYQMIGSSESVKIKVLFSAYTTSSVAFSVLWITHLTNMRAYKALIQLQVHQPFTQIDGKIQKPRNLFIRTTSLTTVKDAVGEECDQQSVWAGCV